MEYPPSKAAGAQVRGPSNSIFQAGYHDMLAFSVSSILVEKIFYRDISTHSHDIYHVAPPYARIVISACLLYVHSKLIICPPWKWQVRAWSTASLSGPLWLSHDSIIYPQPHPNTISPPHILPPGLFCSWLHPTHNWLLKPVQETPPDPLSTCLCIIFLFETTLLWTFLTKHTAHWYKAWLATPHQT